MRSSRASVLALLGLLTLGPALSRAQTALVDNRAASTTSGDSLDSAGEASAHAFTMGAADHRLHSVSVTVNLNGGSEIAVKLWSGAGNTPETLVEDLGSVSNAPGGTSNVLFPSTTRPVLAANARYWVSVANVSGNFDWNLTDSTTNAGSGAAFDDLSRTSGNGGTTWPNAGVSGEYRQFAVFGTPYVPGNVDTTFTPPADLNGPADAIALQPDGRILVGGAFSSGGGLATLNRLVRLEADGSLDTSFTPPADLLGFVRCLALQPDGRILVGGFLFDIGGVTTLDQLVRLEADGTRDMSFTPPADLNNAVNCLVLQPDGRILVGGDFTDAGGVSTLDRLVRLEANGSIDSSFTPPPIAGDFDSVSSIALQPDGRILVGGPLENIGGVATLDRLVRLETDGTRDTSFTPPANLNNRVDCLALQPDGRILVGGDFTDTGGVSTLDRLVRLESGGSLDTSFTPPANLNGRVRTLALEADGRLLVGGNFTNAGGVAALDRLVRLTSAGVVDPAFTPVALNNDVSSAALQVDGRVLVGGLFSDVGGRAHPRSVCLPRERPGERIIPRPAALHPHLDAGWRRPRGEPGYLRGFDRRRGHLPAPRRGGPHLWRLAAHRSHPAPRWHGPRPRLCPGWPIQRQQRPRRGDPRLQAHPQPRPHLHRQSEADDEQDPPHPARHGERSRRGPGRRAIQGQRREMAHRAGHDLLDRESDTEAGPQHHPHRRLRLAQRRLGDPAGEGEAGVKRRTRSREGEENHRPVAWWVGVRITGETRDRQFEPENAMTTGKWRPIPRGSRAIGHHAG